MFSTQITVQIARFYLAAAHNDIPTPPAGTIRSWISRGFVKRTPDGSVDLASLLNHMGIEEHSAA